MLHYYVLVSSQLRTERRYIHAPLPFVVLHEYHLHDPSIAEGSSLVHETMVKPGTMEVKGGYTCMHTQIQN